MPVVRRFSCFIGLCLGGVIVADFLFFEREIGWTAGAFALLLGAAALARNSGAVRRPGMPVPLLLLAACAASLIENVSPLNLLMTAFLLVQLVFALRLGWDREVACWLDRAGVFASAGFEQIWHDSLALRKLPRKHSCGRRRSWLLRVLGAWLVPVLFSLVFVFLFAAANPIISNWLSRLEQWLDSFLTWPELIRAPRILFWLFCFVFVWSLLRARLRTPWIVSELFKPVFAHQAAQPAATIKLADFGDLTSRLTPQFIVRCLVLFNAVFLVQSGLDAVYLWGGRALPEGMSHAEYAHRGAYPLVATALLAAVFVLVTFRPSAPSEGMLWARRLVFAWLGQNVMLTAGAVWRLHLYVDAFTLTRLRLAAGLWMLLVAAGLISIGWRILSGRGNRWLVQVNALSAFGLLYACCFPDIDGFIAMYNVRHSGTVREGGGRIDMEYLLELGPESIPALRWLSEHTPDGQLADRARKLEASLANNLEDRMSDWRAWTFRRHRLLEFSLAAPAPAPDSTRP